MKKTVNDIIEKYQNNPNKKEIIPDLVELLNIDLNLDRIYILPEFNEIRRKYLTSTKQGEIIYNAYQQYGTHLLRYQDLTNYWITTMNIEAPSYKYEKAYLEDDKEPLIEKLTISNEQFNLYITKKYEKRINNYSNHYYEYFQGNDTVEITLTPKDDEYIRIFLKGCHFHSPNHPYINYLNVNTINNAPLYNEETFPLAQEKGVYTFSNQILYVVNGLTYKDNKGQLIDYKWEHPGERIRCICFENIKELDKTIYINHVNVYPYNEIYDYKNLLKNNTQSGIIFDVDTDQKYSQIIIRKYQNKTIISYQKDRWESTIDTTLDNLQEGPIIPEEIDGIIDYLQKEYPEKRFVELIKNELTIFKNKIIEKNNDKDEISPLLNLELWAFLPMELIAQLISNNTNELMEMFINQYIETAEQSKKSDIEHQKQKVKK